MFSYLQTVPAYPSGGGSLTVASENLGREVGLFGAAALMIDYVLVVAVGISAGMGALISAVPSLQPYTLALSMASLVIITLVNLRGVRDTGVVFLFPTYLFVGCLMVAIGLGIWKTMAAAGHRKCDPEERNPMAEAIKDKVVVITGASSGLGEAAARELARHGAKLVLGARRIERLQALAKELSLDNDAVVQTDVTQYTQVKRLVDRAVETHDHLDVMINNAGLMPQSLLEKGKVEEWDHMIDVNIKGVLYGIAAALPYMQRQKSGHFINVSSVAGHKVAPGGAVYSATKHAVRVISEGLRQEVKQHNIRTTIISPGAVATELPNTITDAEVAERIRKVYEIALPAASFANMVIFAMSQPEELDVNEILFRPTRQEY